MDHCVFQLLDLTVNFCPGLTAVIGSVGSGKSSLLYAIAGDMRKTSGALTMPLSHSHCS